MKIVIDLDDDTWVKVLDGYVPLGIGKQLKAGIPIDKFLEDIKAEIYEALDMYEPTENQNHFDGGLSFALDIIDKHIGKEQG